MLLSLDYGPSTVPENDPMADAVARHALEKGVQLYIMTLWATGPPLIEQPARASVIATDFPDKVYGVDYLNLGYKVGNQGLIQSLTSDFKGQYTQDVGLARHPLAPDRPDPDDGARSRRCGDFDLIVAIGSGLPGREGVGAVRGRSDGVPRWAAA